MNADKLLEDFDWAKYFDVEVSEELFELEDVDWDENWDEIGELCGTESLCCVPQAHITEPLAREETLHGDDQVNTCAVATTATPIPFFPKRVVNDNFITNAVLEKVPKNTIRSTNWCRVSFSFLPKGGKMRWYELLGGGGGGGASTYQHVKHAAN